MALYASYRGGVSTAGGSRGGGSGSRSFGGGGSRSRSFGAHGEAELALELDADNDGVDRAASLCGGGDDDVAPPRDAAAANDAAHRSQFALSRHVDLRFLDGWSTARALGTYARELSLWRCATWLNIAL